MFDINKYEKYLIKDYDLDEMRELKRQIREPLPPDIEKEASRVFRIIIEMEKQAKAEGFSSNDLVDIKFDLCKKYHLTKT